MTRGISLGCSFLHLGTTHLKIIPKMAQSEAAMFSTSDTELFVTSFTGVNECGKTLGDETFRISPEEPEFPHKNLSQHHPALPTCRELNNIKSRKHWLSSVYVLNVDCKNEDWNLVLTSAVDTDPRLLRDYSLNCVLPPISQNSSCC